MMILKTSEIKSCRLCGSSDLIVSIDYGNMPMAGGFVLADDPRSSAVAPLRLGICESCGLMQTLDTVDPSEIFSEYTYKSSVSKALVNHFDGLANQIDRIVRSNFDHTPLCIDIGCNDGILLNPLIQRGYRVIGVDPSDISEKASKEFGWTHLKRYMDQESGGVIKSVFGKADVITACNVLAHTDHIHEMIEGVKEALSSKGIFIIEVQYQGSMIDKIQFDTVYHEHCSYFSAVNIEKLLEQHGLVAWNIRRIPTHSGSIRVIASHKGNTRGQSGFAMFEEDKIPPKELAKNFSIMANRARSRIQRMFGLINDRQRTKRCVAYGAAGRSTILINWCKLDQGDIEFVIDSSPIRQGRIVPGTQIPIVDSSHIKNTIDIILITAWNYTDHIIKQHPRYKGLWMVPLPDIRII